MERVPNQVYTEAFRGEAVKLVVEGGLSLSVAARRLSMPKGTLAAWVEKVKEGGPGALKGQGKPVSDVVAENSRLKRELAEARMERDILKKATAYFAKELLPGTRS